MYIHVLKYCIIKIPRKEDTNWSKMKHLVDLSAKTNIEPIYIKYLFMRNKKKLFLTPKSSIFIIKLIFLYSTNKQINKDFLFSNIMEERKMYNHIIDYQENFYIQG